MYVFYCVSVILRPILKTKTESGGGKIKKRENRKKSKTRAAAAAASTRAAGSCDQCSKGRDDDGQFLFFFLLLKKEVCCCRCIALLKVFSSRKSYISSRYLESEGRSRRIVCLTIFIHREFLKSFLL